jgi:hypothetical protein
VRRRWRGREGPRRVDEDSPQRREADERVAPMRRLRPAAHVARAARIAVCSRGQEQRAGRRRERGVGFGARRRRAAPVAEPGQAVARQHFDHRGTSADRVKARYVFKAPAQRAAGPQDELRGDALALRDLVADLLQGRRLGLVSHSTGDALEHRAVGGNPSRRASALALAVGVSNGGPFRRERHGVRSVARRPLEARPLGCALGGGRALCRTSAQQRRPGAAADGQRPGRRTP